MEFSIKSGKSEKQRNDCVIVGVYESGKLSHSAQSIDEASDGFITKILKHGDMDGKVASTLLLHNVKGINGDRVLLVGLGKNGELTDKDYRKAVISSVKALA
jgi:leucyl aminopeptidase